MILIYYIFSLIIGFGDKVARSANTIHRFYLKLKHDFSDVLSDAVCIGQEHLFNLFDNCEGIYDVVHFLEAHNSEVTTFMSFLYDEVEQSDALSDILQEISDNLDTFLEGRGKTRENGSKLGSKFGALGGSRSKCIVYN